MLSFALTSMRSMDAIRRLRWAWFVQGTKPVTGHDFDVLTRVVQTGIERYRVPHRASPPTANSIKSSRPSLADKSTVAGSQLTSRLHS
jgi:hypothetical protein